MRNTWRERAKNWLVGTVFTVALAGAALQGLLALLTSTPFTSFVLAQGNFIQSPIFTGKVSRQSSGVPTVTNGTITGAQLNSSDFYGQFTYTTGGLSPGAILTFSSAWATAPFCIVSVTSAPSVGPTWTVSTTAITFGATGVSSAATVNYMCIGTNN